MKWIDLKGMPILEQLELEKKLLREHTDDYCLINQGTSPAIVMGISGKAPELINLPVQIPVIKRYSGGGTVVVDENTLFVSFIGNHPITPCYPEPLMRWSAQFFPDLTLFQNDFTIGDRKCGGNAQYIKKNRFVHHISFLWDYDLQKMALLKLPKKRPEYRGSRSHNDFLTPLKEHFSSKEAFFTSLKKEIFKHFNLN